MYLWLAVRDHGYEQTNGHTIARNYLRGWFLLDLLSSVPIDQFLRLILQQDRPSPASLPQALEITPVRLLSLLRIARIGR